MDQSPGRHSLLERLFPKKMDERDKPGPSRRPKSTKETEKKPKEKAPTKATCRQVVVKSNKKNAILNRQASDSDSSDCPEDIISEILNKDNQEQDIRNISNLDNKISGELFEMKDPIKMVEEVYESIKRNYDHLDSRILNTLRAGVILLRKNSTQQILDIGRLEGRLEGQIAQTENLMKIIQENNQRINQLEEKLRQNNQDNQRNQQKKTNENKPRPISSRLGNSVVPLTQDKEEDFIVVKNRKSRRSRTRKQIEKAKNEVLETGFIIKNTESKTSLELKKQAYSEILKNNSRPNIIVTNTIKRTGDIYIKPADQKTREAIIKSNLDVVEQKTLKPKLLVYNVDNDLTGEEVINDLIHLNAELRDTEKEKYNAISKRFPQGQPSSRKVSWLLEVDPSIYTKLINGRFFIGMSYCRTQPYDQVTRCFICQRYGHIAKYCPINIQTCMICTSQEKDHDWKNCKLNPKCVNCGKNEPSNHLDCPSRLRAIIQRCKKTNYGTNST